MSAPLEVTVGDIQRLADEPLRELIKRLCLAELSDAGLPSSAVRAGGHQDASDGGIDVRVDLAGAPARLDFIPKGQTGLQAKAESMPPSKVSGEMLDRGMLKPAIRELLTRGGAYVLVSAKDSCTEKMLVQRLAAMRKVVGDAGLPADVALDFLGADRIADWTNRHAGVALWLREHLDGPSHGWRGYGASTAASAAEGFLVDEQPRVEAPGEQGTRQLNIAQTLAELRAKLRDPGKAIRLVGLSGTGKTRLVQALFEASLGDESLPVHLAVYADAGEALQPPPVEMLRRLATQARPVVLVIDNCNPETHRALQTALSIRAGRVALLTVEYDIDSGEAEEADVYRLGVTTPELLDRLLAQREPVLGYGVRQQIVSLSEGNLRIALALASAVRRTGRLNGLSDADLFRRLFWQGRQPDASLEHAARVLALVYSFKVEESDIPETDQEITRLARLAGCSAAELRRHLGTLLDRGLAQRRGPWRAILPHALANHLAARGLGAVSGDALWRELRPHERLSLSFARRLSSLHDSQDARDLVERWFREAPGMEILSERSMRGREVVQLLAPVRPDLALARLEQLTATEGQGLLGEHHVFYRGECVRLAGQLAYQAADFARAAGVLVKLAMHESSGSDERVASMPRPLERLFRPVMSGTEADAAQRLALLASLLDSRDARRQRLARVALQTMLAVNWSGSVPETFGARVRGDGWRPTSSGDWEAWYGGLMQLVAERVCAEHVLASDLAGLVAEAAVRLAWEPAVLPALERFADALAPLPPAPRLWRGIAAALIWPPNSVPGVDPALRARLEKLEARLRPQSLEDRIEALVYVEPHGRVDLLAHEEMQEHRSGAAPGHYDQMLTEVAAELAQRLHESALLPRLIDHFSPGYTPLLGRRTAECVVDLAGDWAALVRRYAAASPASRDSGFIRGFFDGLRARDPAMAEQLLHACVAEPPLAELGVELHTGQTVDEAGAARLTVLARQGQVSAAKFGWLKFGGVLNGIPSASHAELLRAIKDLPDGLKVAIDLHSMRLHGLGDRAREDVQACQLCVSLLMAVDEGFQTDEAWSRVDELAELALASTEGEAVAIHLCRVLTYREQGRHWPLNYAADRLLRRVFGAHGAVALNVFYRADMGRRLDALSQLNVDAEHPVRLVPVDTLLDWVRVEPLGRGPWVAGMIDALDGMGLSATACALLQMAPDRAAVLEGFESTVHPTYSRGSYEEAAAPRLLALKSLMTEAAADVAEWAGRQVERVLERIAFWQRLDRDRDQSFE